MHTSKGRKLWAAKKGQCKGAGGGESFRRSEQWKGEQSLRVGGTQGEMKVKRWAGARSYGTEWASKEFAQYFVSL